MRVLIVKLSSLGDVVHTLPVVHDILARHPDACIDWVVEPGFAPLLQRVEGLHRVIECALRRWVRGGVGAAARSEWRAFARALRQERYDAIIDLQGLTKSALVARLARGVRYGLANRTEGAGYEAPARWLTDHAIRIEPRIHSVDRGRELVARVFGDAVSGAADYGLRVQVTPTVGAPTVVLVHGSSRDDKLWPEADWVAFAQRAQRAGWQIALPHAGAVEAARAQRIAQALDPGAVTVWPALALDGVLDRMAACQGVVGVDSGLSHIAVALDLPHVQLYNWPTAWRTGPQPQHGHRHQVSIEGQPAPSLESVWQAWNEVVAVAAQPAERLS